MNHQKLRVFGMVLGLALVLGGCNETIKIKDGRIPAEFLPYAQPLMGKYSGQMERRGAVIEVSLDQDRPMLTSSVDLIGDCESKIGNLIEISHDKVNGEHVLTQAVFEFDSNRCRSVIGKRLELSFYKENGKTAFEAAILDHIKREYRCDSIADPGFPGRPPFQNCGFVTIGVYLTGDFFKE